MSGYVLMMRSLLGKMVQVTLTDKDARVQQVMVGKLIAFDEMGEVVVQDVSGELHWCWPNLEISPLKIVN